MRLDEEDAETLTHRGSYLGLPLLPAPPQAGGQPLRTDRLALRLSEVLVQPVGPLAHGAHMKPQNVCRSEVRIQRASACLRLILSNRTRTVQCD